MKEDLQKRVIQALDEIRPFLHKDGGDVELVEIEIPVVKVRLVGSCEICKINHVTLKTGIENTIKKFAPEIETVENIS